MAQKLKFFIRSEISLKLVRDRRSSNECQLQVLVSATLPPKPLGPFSRHSLEKKLVNNFEKKSFDEKKSLRVNDSTNLIDKRSISVLQP